MPILGDHFLAIDEPLQYTEGEVIGFSDTDISHPEWVGQMDVMAANCNIFVIGYNTSDSIWQWRTEPIDPSYHWSYPSYYPPDDAHATSALVMIPLDDII